MVMVQKNQPPTQISLADPSRTTFCQQQDWVLSLSLEGKGPEAAVDTGRARCISESVTISSLGMMTWRMTPPILDHVCS